MVRNNGSASFKWTAAGALIAAALLFSGFAAAALEDEIRARIQPVGQVCVQGEQCAAGIAVASNASGEARSPEMVYQTYCQACHETGANESPVRGNAEMWAPRLEQDMETLYMHAIEGFNNNAMPPRGLCTNCSDEEIRATVDYLVAPVAEG